VIASFTYRGVTYRVSGWLWSSDGASNGLIVSRDDGRPIRGAKMHPGMVQTGLSRHLERAAERALEKQRADEREAS
jgi:hypothetical protein